MSNSNSNRPSYIIYAVTKREGSDKGNWQAIGAAWGPHADGKGFSLKLNAIPLNGADIVMREAKEKVESAEDEAA